MYLSFLRPLGPPQASIVSRFLSTSTPITPTAIRSQPANPPKSTPPINHTLLPYRVNRTPSRKLPVYTETKRGGNLKLTKLRKIEGDINTLRLHLKEALRLDEKQIVINRQTNHIVITVSYSPWTCAVPYAQNLREKWPLY
jgi:large subunit ribosomal protein L49